MTSDTRILCTIRTDIMANRRRLNTSFDGYPEPRMNDELAPIDLHLESLLDAITGEEDTEAHSLPSQESVLRKMLSLDTKLSTAFFDDGNNDPDAPSREFKKIGAGACGAVFAQETESFAVKLAKTDDHLSLWNDYGMHASIADEFRNWGFTEIKIAECYYFVPSNDPHYFSTNAALVEAARDVCNTPTAALVTERIPPLPTITRTLLINKYCAPHIKQAAFSDAANDDCLVRVYLGSSLGRAGGQFFSLRNFKMHLNQMVELQLDVEALAAKIGIAMAIMHWAAKTDARDVEFALGSARIKEPPVGTLSGREIRQLYEPIYTGPEERAGLATNAAYLWLLDFNQVQPITMDEAGVAQAVNAAKVNDPYIPRPLQASDVAMQTWNQFVEQYLRASDVILQGGDLRTCLLPRRFIRGLIDVERKRQQLLAANMP